jgi:hypothetical protein
LLKQQNVAPKQILPGSEIPPAPFSKGGDALFPLSKRGSGGFLHHVVMDNLNTHSPASLYEAFAPEEARRLVEKLEIHYTPKHGSWLDIAEIELSVLSRQCLQQRISSVSDLKRILSLWQVEHNAGDHCVKWRFKTDDARIKLGRLYPVLE